MTREVAERAACRDCEWQDERRGCRGRGALHAKHTGHEVTTTRTILYPRSGPLEGQQTFPGLEVAS